MGDGYVPGFLMVAIAAIVNDRYTAPTRALLASNV
jgi:hypothetical protein